jgi:predicted hydrocarbon binding protein
MGMWLEAVLSGLETQTDEKTRVNMLESCGRACARSGSTAAKAKAIKSSGKKIDELLQELSRETSGLVEWHRDDETVSLKYKRCFCPLRRGELVKSKAFCDCSAGWIKEIFETATGRSVTVHIEQAIGRGDPVCRFLIRA